VDPGAVATVDLPGLTSATEELVVDRAGQRVIFGGEMPGVWRMTEAATGWMRDEASSGPTNDLAMLGEGRRLTTRMRLPPITSSATRCPGC